ncbi:MAG: glucosidase [Planctomycetota bacterium]|nr:glucosidase [Planctomycetota bacterium]
MDDQTTNSIADAEANRLAADSKREANWKRWGPYLSERQWGTVREDYSADGDCWGYFPHDHARSRAYRWGEDGLLGITDRECRLCFSLALWNDRDPILKERLFGLTGPQGNHGEDVKEQYFYLDSSPTHSYMKALYKYPQGPFPYEWLVNENAKRTRLDPEFELVDTKIFDDNRYFDVFAEYAKNAPDDMLIRITVANRGPSAAVIHLLPTLWARNTWTWGCTHEGCEPKPHIARSGPASIDADHSSLGNFRLAAAQVGDDQPKILFTENETNLERIFSAENYTPYVKDAFHRYIVHNDAGAVNPAEVGTKAAFYYCVEVPAGGEVVVRLRLFPVEQAPSDPFDASFDHIFQQRIAETDAFYEKHLPSIMPANTRQIARQGFAGLLWSKQFYHYVVREWLEGDPDQPPPPKERWQGRNREWLHLFNRDVISMPDAWEYPWYAGWDLAFHTITFATIDPEFAKEQLILMLREWYMHPNGQLPAYEFEFSDVNPPVHAWAAWRVYKMTAPRGKRDRAFLERVFQKLLMNFTWWVNRKDINGKNIFGGGFLGLDNIGVFDRSKPLPTGGTLDQADGTAWMAFYCSTMLSIALELAREDIVYEDIASKFFEHFVAIVDAMNTLGGTGLWDEQDGFYYDQLSLDGKTTPLRVRSMVGMIPLFAVEVLDGNVIDQLKGFRKRMQWFLDHRKELARNISYMKPSDRDGTQYLLAIPSQQRLERVLKYLLDQNEFLSPFGIRSLSRVHKDRPYVFNYGGKDYGVKYCPGESDTALFGGNSNWRGPVWFPLNFILLESLEKYHYFYGDKLKVEFPAGTGTMINLQQVADELGNRLMGIFHPDKDGRRACHGEDTRFADDPNWNQLVLFYEYFHGDTGRGVGASHQTGWTALVSRIIVGRGKKLLKKQKSAKGDGIAAK